MLETSAVTAAGVVRPLGICSRILMDLPALLVSEAAIALAQAMKASVRRIFWIVSACAIMAASVTHAGPLVTVGANFAGCNINTCPAVPPDTDGAVGPDQFVEFLNGGYRVYKKSGMLLQQSSLFNFWSSAGVTPIFPFDPRVLYDPTSQRWFASSADNAFTAPSSIFVAVSKTSDPTQGWRAVAIPNDSTHWFDFPKLGISRDGLFFVVGSNPISSAGGSINIIAIPKSDLLQLTPTAANATVFSISQPEIGLAQQPAVGPQSASSEPILSDFFFNALKISSVDGPITSPSLNTVDRVVSVSPPEAGDLAIQKGTSIRIVDGGNFSSSVVLQNDRLFAVQSFGQGGHPALRWFEIGDPLTAPVVLDSGIIHPANLDVYFGSIAVNPFGEVVIGFTGSGPDDFASAYAVAGILDGDMLTFGDPILLKAGVAPYELGGNPARWGDYSATTYDPSDPSHFWTIQEWALGQFEWSTEISEIIFGTQMVMPEPSSILILGIGLVGLVLLRRRAGPPPGAKNIDA